MSNSTPSTFQIRHIDVSPPLVLAPMEDVTNQPFRVICKRIGNPGLMVSEFVSAMAVHYGAKKTTKKMQILDEERPLSIQIFGSDIDAMVEAAVLSEEMGADIVDINMGCWVPKVVRTGAGAALLKDPALAEQIVIAVVNKVRVPVTVKVRAGWDGADFSAPDLAKRFEAAGAQAITLHARFAKQGFDGQANWDLIRHLKEAVKIPVIGNGDIRSHDDAIEMFQKTGCDGVMVGRGAISNPWLLARITAAISNQPIPEEPTLAERCETAIEHLKLLVAFEAEVTTFEEAQALPRKDYELAEMRSVRHLRGQLPLYVKGARGAAQVRDRLTHCDTVEQVVEILTHFSRVNGPDSPQA